MVEQMMACLAPRKLMHVDGVRAECIHDRIFRGQVSAHSPYLDFKQIHRYC